MNKKIIVIGAGVIGAALAYELTNRGAQVTVLEAGEPGTGTSEASFAWVNSNNKTPKAYSDLNLLGISAHEKLVSQFRPEDRWFYQTGTIEVGNSDEQIRKIEEKMTRMDEYGYGAEALTRARIQELEPNLDPEAYIRGALYPKEGWVDTHKMCNTLLNSARSAGANVRPHEMVNHVEPRKIITTNAFGERNIYVADSIIISAGNGIKDLLRDWNIDYPIIDPMEGESHDGRPKTNVGIMTTTSRVSNSIGHIIRADGIAMRPARNGGVTFADHPTGGRWPLNDPRIWSLPEELFGRARQLFPPLSSVVTESVRLGVRVLPRDGLTISDWVDKEKSVYSIATHGGVTLSAHLGACVAEEIISGDRDPSLRNFGLDRSSLWEEGKDTH